MGEEDISSKPDWVLSEENLKCSRFIPYLTAKRARIDNTFPYSLLCTACSCRTAGQQHRHVHRLRCFDASLREASASRSRQTLHHPGETVLKKLQYSFPQQVLSRPLSRNTTWLSSYQIQPFFEPSLPTRHSSLSSVSSAFFRSKR